MIVDSDSINDDFLEEDSNDEEEEETKEGSKKNKALNYGKLAVALNKIISAGIKITPPEINVAEEGFSPNPDTQEIVYAFKGLKGVGSAEIEEIIKNRPYKNFEDFYDRTKLKRTSIISLIKAGAFDKIEERPREEIMRAYISKISDVKETLNMRNLTALIKKDLIPEQFSLEKRTFNFFRYLKQKQFKVAAGKYLVDERSLNFLQNNYPTYDTYCSVVDNNLVIDADAWKKAVYDKALSPIKDYIKDNLADLLEKFNKEQIDETWQKYCLGTLSKWEMDSMGFYFHEHELAHVNLKEYLIASYEELPEAPEVDRVYRIKGREIPLFKITKIIGTVISKNNIAKSFSLLTPKGSVVNVRMSDEHYALFNKQISENIGGAKKVREKSWFTSGNKLMLVGFRRDDSFVLKKYKDTIEQHRIYLITDIKDNGDIIYTAERYGVSTENDL